MDLSGFETRRLLCKSTWLSGFWPSWGQTYVKQSTATASFRRSYSELVKWIAGQNEDLQNEFLNDDEIVQTVMRENEEIEVDGKVDGKETRHEEKISHSEGRAAFQLAATYIEQQTVGLLFINKWRDFAFKKHLTKKSRKRKLISFFNPCSHILHLFLTMIMTYYWTLNKFQNIFGSSLHFFNPVWSGSVRKAIENNEVKCDIEKNYFDDRKDKTFAYETTEQKSIKKYCWRTYCCFIYTRTKIFRVVDWLAELRTKWTTYKQV